MTRTIVAGIVLVLSLSTIVAASNFSTASLVSAQMSTSAGRMHLDEGIKVLKTGNIRGALMHLHIADKILGGMTSTSAQTGRMHLDEGIKVLSTVLYSWLGHNPTLSFCQFSFDNLVLG